jgi:sterol desaturase/sphingolipid hydroxylase (fatty acid hydroxylase superfamily)
MVENFAAIYAVIFFVTVITLAVCELLPWLNGQTVRVTRRWPTNVGLFALNLAVLWICMPISAVDAANRAGSGALALPADAVAGIALGVLALDLWKYLEHRLMHRFSILWRFHLVHHSDVEVDFTTTERHHPIEAAISTAILYVLIYLIAIPPLAVVIFVLTGTVITLFSHANLCLPTRIDRMLRWLIVTPSVHVIHHSARREDTDSNYGVILTVWDRLFGTYRVRPVCESPMPSLGLEIFRAPIDARLDRVLWQPIGYSPRHREPERVSPPCVDRVKT